MSRRHHVKVRISRRLHSARRGRHCARRIEPNLSRLIVPVGILRFACAIFLDLRLIDWDWGDLP